ncbi:HK97 gp10 family phage protein [Exiguobacterium sp. s130]|uniref:HK97 gp10 family phage protein n=1 Tax=Exiguobacterium sp. s130 TaxID=2751190 RepID=UPI00255739E9|nr:HK97 gp10 family phage protein [Exiguobacterium sp. s130]
MNGFDDFARDMDRIRKDFDQEIPLIMEAVGAELLAETRKEIVRQQLVDTRDMLNSFSLGNSFNIFEKRKGGYEVEAGTGNPYAIFVNEGHWTVGRKSFVEPTHFFDIAQSIAEQYMAVGIMKRIDGTIKRRLGG